MKIKYLFLILFSFFIHNSVPQENNIETVLSRKSINLDITYRCTLECPKCLRRAIPTNNLHDLSLENFKRRTSALEIPADIYRLYDEIVKGCESCQKFHPAPERCSNNRPEFDAIDTALKQWAHPWDGTRTVPPRSELTEATSLE